MRARPARCVFLRVEKLRRLLLACTQCGSSSCGRAMPHLFDGLCVVNQACIHSLRNCAAISCSISRIIEWTVSMWMLENLLGVWNCNALWRFSPFFFLSPRHVASAYVLQGLSRHRGSCGFPCFSLALSSSFFMEIWRFLLFFRAVSFFLAPFRTAMCACMHSGRFCWAFVFLFRLSIHSRHPIFGLK